VTRTYYVFFWAALSLGLGISLAARPARGEDGPDEAWIKRRVDEVKKAEINGWRKIPWVSSLLEARRLSEQEKKPVFLFSHDGNIETGRC
jgi:hypothetical protein